MVSSIISENNNVEIIKIARKKWSSMIYRCGKHKSYLDCNVSEEWLIFDNFYKWMITKDFKNKELDKDIILPGNKIYSKDTCCFVYRSINLLFRETDCAYFGKGITYNTRQDSFSSTITINKVRHFLGCFKTAKEAKDTYNIERNNYINYLADIEIDKDISRGMRLHANLILKS